jgi:glycosyltransferase involved in cell wall biosynthesis
MISIPVTLIPQPMRLLHPPQAPQKDSFGLSDKFTFLFCFDFHGHLVRKNPMAIVKAFKTAFPLRDDVRLVIKSHNGHLYQPALETCLEEVNKDVRIRWIDESMERQRVYDLMNACDCYVSLHRSEGLGMTMAEAMLLGKPVIATGYSGNMDFTTQNNSYLCGYNLLRVGPNHFPYPPDGMWADVDTTEAASWMSHVTAHRAEASARGTQGRADILRNNSTRAVGSLIAQRIALLLHSRGFSETMRSHRKHVRHVLSVYKKYWSDLWIHYRGAIQRRIQKYK